MLTALVLIALTSAPKVVSPEWHAVNVKPELAEFYAQQLSEALRRQGLDVVTSQDVKALLNLERQKQLIGCSTDSGNCLMELANALGCDATLTVNLARFDDGSFHGVAKLLSARDGHVLSSAQLDSKSDKALLESIDAAGPVLAAALQAPPAPRAARSFWWVPAGVTLVSGIGAAALFAASNGSLGQLRTSASVNDAGLARDAGKWLQTGGWLAAGLAGAGLVATGLLLWLGGAEPVGSTHVALVPTGPGFALSGSFP